MKIVLDMGPRFFEIFSKMDKSTLVEGETDNLSPEFWSFKTYPSMQHFKRK
jgi:hypothetical protein